MVSWRAGRVRTAIVAVTTITAGLMATFGLLATQRVLVELFAGGPTPDRIRAAMPALVLLAVVTTVRAGLGIAVGYARNGLTPRVSQAVERGLFEVTTRRTVGRVRPGRVRRRHGARLHVRHADVIHVLDHGRLYESGSHDDLMAQGGRYAELFTMQTAGYRETNARSARVRTR